MPVNVGQIVVSLGANTSQFTLEMNRAQAAAAVTGGKIQGSLVKMSGAAQSFGKSLHEASSHGVTDVQATSAALRTLEGGMTNNLRAAERFAASTLGLGPILQKVFPVAGALALGGVLFELVGKIGAVIEAFKKMQEAPQRIAVEFNKLILPIEIANAEMQVSNDRLDNQIAKLEGHPQNTLKLALDEARLSALQLAAALDKDLEAMNKLLAENNVNAWQRLLGEASTDEIRDYFGGKRGLGGFRERVSTITDKADEDFGAIKSGGTKEEQQAAKTQGDTIRAKERTALEKEYGDAIAFVNGQLEKRRFVREAEKNFGLPGAAGAGEDDAIAELEKTKRLLRDEVLTIKVRYASDDKKTKLAGDEASQASESLTAPYREKLIELNQQIAATKHEMATIGQTATAEILAKSFADAQQEIDRLNAALARHHQALSKNQETSLHAKYDELELAKADTAWTKTLDDTTTSISNRIAAMRILTDAIGKGAAAERQAAIESQLIQKLGKHYDDKQWMADHQKTIVQPLRAVITTEVDAKSSEESAKNIDKLNEEVDLEKSLAAVQYLGAAAVRAVTFEYRLRNLAAKGATDEQIDAEVALFEATNKNRQSGDLTKLNEQIDATRRLSAAQLQGAEAYRQKQLQIKYEQLQLAGANPLEIETAKSADEVKHQEDITAAATQTGMAYQNRLESLNQEIARVRELIAQNGNLLEYAISLKSLDQERVKVLSEQALATGSAADGVRAFFREMAAEGQSAAQKIHDVFKSAFGGLNDELAKLISGQQANWSSFFQGLSQQFAKLALEDTEKMIAQRLGGVLNKKPGTAGAPGAGGAVGGLGGILGSILGTGAAKRDGNSPDTALWVQIAGVGGALAAPGGAKSSVGTGAGVTLPDIRSGGFGGVALPKTLPSLGTAAIAERGGIPRLSPEQTNAADTLTRLPSGLIQRASAGPGLTTEDLGNLGDFQPSELGQLAEPAAGASPNLDLDALAAQLSPDTGSFDDTSSASSFSNVSLPAPQGPSIFSTIMGSVLKGLGKSEAGATGGGTSGGSDGSDSSDSSNPASDAFGGGVVSDNTDSSDVSDAFGGGVVGADDGSSGSSGSGSAAKGALGPLMEIGIGLLGMLFKKGKVDHHFRPGNPYTLPSWGGFRAEGGPVDPGSAYMVGEQGPEIWTPPASGGSIVSNRDLNRGGDATHIYIDARGTDPAATEQRVRQAMATAHNGAVRTSFRATQEFAKRTPPPK